MNTPTATFDTRKPFRKKIRDGLLIGLFCLLVLSIIIGIFYYDLYQNDFDSILTISVLSITFVGLSLLIYLVIRDAYKDLKQQEFFTFQAIVLDKEMGIQGRASWYYHLELELLDNKEQALLFGKFVRKELIKNSSNFRLFYTANVTKELYPIIAKHDEISVTISRYSRHIMELKKQTE